MRRLLVVSHTPHYRDVGGTIRGWGPTVREIDHLAELFDTVTHVAPLHRESPPESALPYESPRVRLRAVKPSGGARLRDKVGALAALPSYARVIGQELEGCDVVHVRSPASVSLAALVALTIRREPVTRWVKYAGSWRPNGGEPWSYRLQRWWIERGLVGGLATINGWWDGQPAHVHSFLNPSLTMEELEEAGRAARAKTLGRELRLVYVGQLAPKKGTDVAIETVAALREAGHPAYLDVAGDGPERARCEWLARTLGMSDAVTFHGWLPRPALAPLYAVAHFTILPSATEGWPKVLSEGMAYGAVPIALAVSSIPQILARFHVGRAIASARAADFAAAIAEYAANPERWRVESVRAAETAVEFTYDRYLDRVAELLGIPTAKSVVHAGVVR